MCGIFGCIHNSNYKFKINYFKEINKVNSNRGPDKFQSKEVLINNLRIKLNNNLTKDDRDKNKTSNLHVSGHVPENAS